MVQNCPIPINNRKTAPCPKLRTHNSQDYCQVLKERREGRHRNTFSIIHSLNPIHPSVFSVFRYWLSQWSAKINITTSERDMLLGVYGAFGVGQVISLLIFTSCLYVGSIQAAKSIHGNMLRVILRCPMSLFDTTPLGRSRIYKCFAEGHIEMPDVFV